MRILVVGAGATGGYFGGRLAAAGRDVTFLVRGRRAERLRSTGLQIVSPKGDAFIRPKLATAADIASTFDVVLLTVKAYSLEEAMADFAPAVGPDTMILPVLNGMKHMDVLASRFGAHHVVGGICKVAATIDDDGRIVQLASFHELVYGELNGARSERMERLDELMRNAGFDASLSPVIGREMWEKWSFLASLGGINCLMRGNVGKVASAPGGKEFANALLDEVLAVVNAVGVPPRESFCATIRAQLTDASSPLTSSMYRDLEKGNPIESEQVVGDLVARAHRAGVPVPLLSAAYVNLCVARQGS